MRPKKHTRTRVAALTAGVAAIATVTISPARADVPPAGEQFLIKTQHMGQTLCVASRPTDRDERQYPLVPCTKSADPQIWKRSANGRCIENFGTGAFLEHEEMLRKWCGKLPKGAFPWQQDDKGRIFRYQGRSTSNSRLFLGAWPKESYLGFPKSDNGTLPPHTLVFTFETI
ncbi:hypothetical protein ACFWBH_01430 [Streptomyces sp. NPDC059999]|uniref:hypothetical protein n=1 Tax=Streptomyces sp. NPDC059999 TaxID=3347030 RepID=UPI0036820B0F